MIVKHPHIRDATEADLPAIVDIYDQSIPAGWSTADTEPVTVAARIEWFHKFDPARRPIWPMHGGSWICWRSAKPRIAGWYFI